MHAPCLKIKCARLCPIMLHTFIIFQNDVTHLLAYFASSPWHRRVTSCRGTLPSLLEHVCLSTIARINYCAIFGLQKPAVMVMLMMSLLSLPVTTAQTCANPMLGQARSELVAASLSSGLVFFAGGRLGAEDSVCVYQLRRASLCGRDLTTTVVLCCSVPMILRARVVFR